MFKPTNEARPTSAGVPPRTVLLDPGIASRRWANEPLEWLPLRRGKDLVASVVFDRVASVQSFGGAKNIKSTMTGSRAAFSTRMVYSPRMGDLITAVA